MTESAETCVEPADMGAGRPDGSDGSDRAPRAVLESHLRLRQAGDLETDIAENYHRDVVLLSAEGVSRGHDGVRRLAAILRGYVAEGSYDYRQILIEGDFGMLAWTAQNDRVRVHDGADSYVVRHGKIIAQTVHYSVDRTGAHAVGT
jgi:hypothetical protein